MCLLVFTPWHFYAVGFLLKFFYMDYIQLPAELIRDTPNDLQLGEIIRKLYYQTKPVDRGQSEQDNYERSESRTELQRMDVTHP